MTFKKGYQVATRIGQNLGNRWGAELTYSYIHHKMLLANPQPNLASLEFGHTIHRFDYDMLLYMLGRSSRVRPFAIAGSGVALFRTPEVGKSHAADAGVQVMDRIKLSINWGGGLKCLVHENVAIRFEFSDRMTGVPNYAFVPGFKATGMLHDRMLNLGLVYYWRTR
jgi:opacity protein-like surface antigen